MSQLVVSQLAIYPVKSLGQIILQQSRIDDFGLQWDRRWMLVDSNNHMITQRQQPRMCLITPHLGNGKLRLSAAGMSSIMVAFNQEADPCTVTVWHDTCRALGCGDEVADWLTRFLGIACRLVYFPDDGVRAVDPDFSRAGDRTAFSDGFPLLLTTQASLDDLNARLESPISMARFRPNLVVSGCEPYAEDTWQRLRIGPLTFRVVKPCSRCSIPTIDLTTAECSVEPSRTLSQYRKRGHKVYFGQNIIPDTTGSIEVGTAVEVLGACR